MVEDDEDRSAQMTIHAELSLASQTVSTHASLSINQSQAGRYFHRSSLLMAACRMLRRG